MRASRKARLDRLMAVHEEAFCKRALLRLYAETCPVIREAMLRAGVDPASCWAMRETEEELAAFVDTPELQRADFEFQARQKEEEAAEEADLIDGIDWREWLIARLEEIGRGYGVTARCPTSDPRIFGSCSPGLRRSMERRTSRTPRRLKSREAIGAPASCRRNGWKPAVPLLRRPATPAGAFRERRRSPRRRPGPACCGS